MMRPLTKYTRQLVSGVNIRSRVREAMRLAQEEKPGSVHLELPEDIAAEQPIPASLVRRPIAEAKSIQAAVEMICAARSPLLLVGAGANRKLTCNMLRKFVEKFEIPFVTTQMGKGVIDERDPRFLGNTALSANDFVHRAVEAADLIINVGHDVVEKPPFFMRVGGVRVIHINFSSASVDPVYFPQVEVVGDIANSIWQLFENIECQSQWDFARFMTDGGFMIISQELETAVWLKFDLVVLVLRDNAYGMIKWKQANMGLNDSWRKRLASGQAPFATILGCSDSRVPPELLFDQGFGDLFVIRVAGNVVDTDVPGSVEYGVDHLGTKLVVVMGHESCGAVTAALRTRADFEREPNEIQALVGKIHPAIKGVSPELPFATRLQRSVEANVRASARQLCGIPDLKKAIDKQKTKIIGCVYDIKSGRVRTFRNNNRES